MNQGYSNIPSPGYPAQTESWAMIEAAKRMAEAVLNGDVEAMRASLRLNWRLWTIFQAALSESEEGIPAEIRENMLRLSLFVDKHTVASLVEPTPERLNTLVNINRNIAQGLMAGMQRAAEAQSAAQAEMPPAPAMAPQTSISA
jgi:flagellar protein FlaF